MHQALYRKYRPRTFDDVCGQEHITSVLRYEVEHAALSHAYLFCGSRGTGKTTCAKILAKAVNCENPAAGSPCGKCAACLAIENGSATDVMEMDAASNNGVDNIRDIRDQVVYSPSLLKYRVYIVDEVHMLSPSAFNALLKTLEEPPAHVIFILATTELQKLPATIISRCQRFDFRRISVPVLSDRLSYIAKEEKIDLSPDAAEAIARAAQGGMRDAISLLELCAGATMKVDLATVFDMMGSGGREELLELVGAIMRADYDKIFDTVAAVVASARDLTVFWQDLIALYRDLLVIKTAANAAAYLDLTDSEAAALGKAAAGYSRARLLAHCRLLEDALFAMQRANAVKRMVAELTLVRMSDLTLDTAPENLVARLTRLEDALAAGAFRTFPAKAEKTEGETAPAVSIKEKPPVPATAAAPAESAPLPAETTPRADVSKGEEKAVTETPAPATAATRLRGFANVVERVRRDSPMFASFLDGARAFLLPDGKVEVRLADAFAESMLSPDDSRALIARAVGAERGTPLDAGALVFSVRDGSDAEDDDFDELIAAMDGANDAEKGETT